MRHFERCWESLKIVNIKINRLNRDGLIFWYIEKRGSFDRVNLIYRLVHKAIGHKDRFGGPLSLRG